MTLTLWSNAGRHEFIIRKDGKIIASSGLIYPNRSAAKRAAMKKAETL